MQKQNTEAKNYCEAVQMIPNTPIALYTNQDNGEKSLIIGNYKITDVENDEEAKEILKEKSLAFICSIVTIITEIITTKKIENLKLKENAEI